MASASCAVCVCSNMASVSSPSLCLPSPSSPPTSFCSLAHSPPLSSSLFCSVGPLRLPRSHAKRQGRLHRTATNVQKTDSEPILSGSGKESEEAVPSGETKGANPISDDVSKKLFKAVRTTAATFAPRASTPQRKNPAFPGSTLYSVFEWQAYISMALGGLLAFNVIFPSDEPDIWRLMGMWSVWMFTIPSLRARDCSLKEKDALNYLFILVPLINVTLPLLFRSFSAVWTADVVAFLAMYAWKMEWLAKDESS